MCKKCGSKRIAELEYTDGEKTIYCYTCGHEEKKPYPLMIKEVLKSMQGGKYDAGSKVGRVAILAV